MALSKKLRSIDEQISCDPAYVSKVSTVNYYCHLLLYRVVCDWFFNFSQIGRERPKFDFDDFDSVPHRFI